MRKAATEVKALGQQTFREMNVAQKKYVIDRVSFGSIFLSDCS